MILPGDASDIVRLCILKVNPQGNKHYSHQKTLEQLGLSAPEFVGTFIGQICTDEEIGVRKYNHEITEDKFKDVKPQTTASVIENVIMQKSTKLPLQPHEMIP